jgi:GTPase
VEYKRQLHNCTSVRLEKLKTQMSYRLDEGRGCCVYQIGVEDDGCHSLLDYNNVAETARVLELLARSLNAVVLERKMIQNEITQDETGTAIKGDEDAITVDEPSLLGDGNEQINEDYEPHHEEKSTDEVILQEHQLNKDGAYTRGEIMIQRVETHLLDPSPISLSEVDGGEGSQARDRNDLKSSTPGNNLENVSEQHMSVGETLAMRNIRVAVVGNVDAGKSTMIGTLTSSMLDDGRGSSRTSIMKHRHEIETGRTSTATTHLMGFRSTGEAITSQRDHVRANRRKTEDEVARESYRIITLMDLAGHEKYLKTT